MLRQDAAGLQLAAICLVIYFFFWLPWNNQGDTLGLFRYTEQEYSEKLKAKINWKIRHLNEIETLFLV